MIQYEHFAFAAAPRTGAHWFGKACGADWNAVHVPPQLGWRGVGVTITRHPYDWLASIYGACSSTYVGLHCGHDMAKLLRASSDVYDFIRSIAQRPGRVAEVFAQYAPLTIALRLEDFPWAVVELLESVGMPTVFVVDTPPINARRGTPHVVDAELRRAVVRSERDFCERYNYS